MLFPKDEQLELRNKFYDRWIKNSPDAYLNSLRVFRGWSVMHQISSLSMPTLVIAADQDYTPVSFKQMYCKFIPKCQLVIIEDSRHITIADQPELFNVALMNFLRTSY
jgi:pimeloyl-ACP methyl ester carboxylesterase